MGPTPQGFTGQTYPKEQLEEAGLAQKHSWASVRVGAQGWGRTGSMRVTAAMKLKDASSLEEKL